MFAQKQLQPAAFLLWGISETFWLVLEYCSNICTSAWTKNVRTVSTCADRNRNISDHFLLFCYQLLALHALALEYNFNSKLKSSWTKEEKTLTLDLFHSVFVSKADMEVASAVWSCLMFVCMDSAHLSADGRRLFWHFLQAPAQSATLSFNVTAGETQQQTCVCSLIVGR